MTPPQTVAITVEERRAAVARIQKLPVDVDYYDILQVQDDCDAAEIRKAYKTLVLLVHPDKAAVAGVRGATEAFKVVLNAYQTLNDPTERAVYDTGRRPSTGFDNSAGAQASASGAAPGSSSAANSQPSQNRKSGKKSKNRRQRYNERASEAGKRQREAREAQARAEAEAILQHLAEMQRSILQDRVSTGPPLWEDILHMVVMFSGVGTLLYFGWKILYWALAGDTIKSTLLGIALWIAFQAYAPILWANRVWGTTLVMTALGVGYGVLVYAFVPLAKGGVDVLSGAARML